MTLTILTLTATLFLTLTLAGPGSMLGRAVFFAA